MDFFLIFNNCRSFQSKSKIDAVLIVINQYKDYDLMSFNFNEYLENKHITNSEMYKIDLLHHQ